MQITSKNEVRPGDEIMFWSKLYNTWKFGICASHSQVCDHWKIREVKKLLLSENIIYAFWEHFEDGPPYFVDISKEKVYLVTNAVKILYKENK